MKIFVAIATLIAVVSGGTIDSSLKEKLIKGETLDINVVLNSIEDIYSNSAAAISTMQDTDIRIASMIAQAENETKTAQAPFQSTLLASGVNPDDITSFWISNEFFVKNADLTTVEVLLSMEGNFHIREPIKVNIVEPVTEDENATISQNVQWGVQTINAPSAWQKTR